jgi:hypothetical protein
MYRIVHLLVLIEFDEDVELTGCESFVMTGFLIRSL